MPLRQHAAGSGAARLRAAASPARRAHAPPPARRMRAAPRAANPPAEAGRREQGGGGGCARRPPPPYCGAVSARRARRLVPGGAASSTGAAPQRRAGAAGVGSERPEPCGAGSASPPDPPAGRGSAAPGEARRDGGAEAALRRLRAPRRRREGAAGGPRSSPPAPLRYLCPVSGEGRGGIASQAGAAGSCCSLLCAARGRCRRALSEPLCGCRAASCWALRGRRSEGVRASTLWDLAGFCRFFLNLSAGRSLSLSGRPASATGREVYGAVWHPRKLFRLLHFRLLK